MRPDKMDDVVTLLFIPFSLIPTPKLNIVTTV